MRNHKLQNTMKKFLLLLALLGVVFTACQSGLDNGENGGNPSIPKIELSQQTVEVDFEPDTYTVSVTSPYSWDATSKNDDWIIVDSKTGIAGTKELKFSIERNENEEVREGTILLTNNTFNLATELYVIQKAFEPKITIEPKTLNFATEGGTQDITIKANFEYTVSTTADWISYTETDNVITITAPEYAEVEERTADIIISSDKYNNISEVVKVTQGAFEPKLYVEPSELNFAVEGGTQKVVITANFECKVSTDADWFTVAKTDNGISVTVPAYAEVEERTADIIISSDKYNNISEVVKVTQNGLSEEEYQKQRIIFYTSSDGEIVAPYKIDAFGANIVSNTYENGKGVIKFDAPITSIGDHAFYECSSLTSVTIPDGVTSIGNHAFSRCTSLTSVAIGNSVTSIGGCAFYECSSLTSITIPDSVTSIGISTFSDCSSLTSITIPDSVTSIGISAFSDCSSLTSITIPNSVTSIGEHTFSRCSNLTAFYGKFASADNRCLIVEGVLNSFAPAGSTFYTIPDGVTSIGACAFYLCSSLTSVTIPDSVTSIGNSAFSCCSSLTSITIPDGVTKIGELAFYECISLTSITIPDSVTSIGYWAFYGCSSLASVYCKATTPPAGGSNMFGYDASGRKIYVPRNSVEAYKAKTYWRDYASDIVGYDF